MNRSITAEHTGPHRVIADVKPQMAKATVTDIRKADEQWRRRVGRLVEALRRAHGWTLDEFAGKLDKDARQVSRWERGEERPHFDAILAIEELHRPLLLAFADLLQHCVESETTIRIRRTA